MIYRKDITFSDSEGVSLYLTTKCPENLDHSYSVVVINADNGDIIFKRKFDKDKIQINLPRNPLRTSVFTTCREVENYISSPLKKNQFDYDFTPETERDFPLSDLKVQYVENLGYTPARILTKQGVMQISKKHFRDLDQPTRYFIMMHEMGHYYFNDEDKADEYAFNACMKRGYGLSVCYNALANVLRDSKPNLLRKIKMMQNLKSTYQQ